MKRIFNLKKFREDHKLKQEQFASSIGINQSDVSRYEKNPESIPLSVALDIIYVYNITDLNDFLNDEIPTSAPISMENIFAPISERKKRYIEKLNSLLTPYIESEIETKRNPIEIYMSGPYLIEKMIHDSLAKPTIAFISARVNATEKNNLISDILGISKTNNINIPVFYVDKKTRPEWASTSKYNIPEDKTKDFDFLDKDILYFKKPLQGNFDIKALDCLGYASFSLYNFENPFIDCCLNQKDEKDADSAVVFVESEILQNTNILSISADMEQYLTYNSDIAVCIGTEDEIENIRIQSDNVFKIFVGTTKKITENENYYSYSLFSSKDNEPFIEALKKAITSYIDELKKNTNYETYFLEYFKRQSHLPEHPVKADKNFILSRIKNYENDTKIAVLNSKNDTIKAFDKIFYEEIASEKIEKILLDLGNKTYPDSDEKKSFPCNKNDLEAAKNTIFDSLLYSVHKMLQTKLLDNIRKLLEIINIYKTEDGLFRLYDFEEGLNFSLNELHRKDDDSYYQLCNDITSTINLNVKNWKENTEEPLRKVFFNDLEPIITFARGSSLSKAKKISSALLSNYRDFTNVLDDYWDNYNSYLELLISIFFNEETLDKLPRSEEALENLRKKEKLNAELATELKKIAEKEHL